MKPSARQIEMIEDLPLRASDRWYVLLALTRHKKASWVSIESDVWREGDDEISVDKDRLSRFENVLNTLRLPYACRLRDTDAGLYQPDEGSIFRKRMNQICDIFVGCDEESVEELRAAVEIMDHKRVGHALCYPASAVEAFGTNEAVSIRLLQRHDQLECEPYVWFMLSRQNYENELLVVQEWFEVVKEYSPIIKLKLRKEA